MKKTVLLHAFHRQELLAHLLTEQSFVVQTEFLSLSSFLEKKTSEIDHTSLFIQAHQTLQSLRSDLHLLYAVLEYCETTAQLFDFTRECALYGIDLNQLSEDSEKNREIKQCVLALSFVYQAYQAQRDYIDSIEDASYIETALPIQNYSEHFLLKILQSKGSQTLSLPQVDSSDSDFFHAQNPRQEMESCLQHILQFNQKDAVVVLSDYDHQIEVFKAIASRYKIPLNRCKDSRYNPTIISFQHLLHFYTQPTYENLKKVVLNGVIAIDFAKEWANYFDLNCHDLYPLEESLTPLELQESELDERFKRDYATMQEKALHSHNQIISQLNSIPEALEDKIVSAYDLIAALYPNQSVLQLRDYLSEHLNSLMIHPPTALAIIDYHLQQMTFSESSQDGLRVVDLNHLPLIPVDNLYVLQTNQAHYPAYTTKEGLIDESYLAGVTGYPSLEQRLSFQKLQRDQISHLAQHVTYSFYDGNYEGKSSDVAFEVESKFDKHHLSRWPLIHHETKLNRDHGLSASTSKALFLRNDEISGSVSRFELFQKSPYSYFLKYGLRVYEPSSFDVEFALLGQIRHRILELLAKEKGKNYSSPSSIELKELVDHRFSIIEELLPLKTAQLAIMKQRMIHSLAIILEFLKESDNTSNYTIHQSEFRFEKMANLSKQNKIKLTGVIDRIDQNTHSIRIIDYKSSDHDLSETQVKRGYQLQLCSYAIMAQRIFEKPVAGVYYVNLRIPTVQSDFASFSIRQGLTLSATLEKEDFLKESRLKGWTFIDPIQDYSSASYIKGFKDKSGVISASLFSLDKIQELLETIYSDIENQILEGSIDLDPRHSEFTFEYQHFREPADYQYEMKPPYLEDVSLKVKS